MGELSDEKVELMDRAKERHMQLKERFDDGELTIYDMMRGYARLTCEWAGIPLPLDGFELVIEDRYPLKDILEEVTKDAGREVAVDGDTTFTLEKEPEKEDEPKWLVRNKWYSKRRGGYVWILQDPKDQSIKVWFDPKNHSSEKMDLLLGTLGASDAWDPKAEIRAQKKLKELVSERQWDMYLLTGSFIESSERSRHWYIFRKGRPTLVMGELFHDPNGKAPLKIQTALCAHPIAYYMRTWAGAMTPTDDVIAHLLMMRGDEVLLWRRCNQHHPDEPEAGL